MTDTIQERIEAHANEVLWASHVIGPDEMWAMPSHAEAVARSDKLNAHVNSKPRGEYDALCFAYPTPWDGTRDGHADDMKEQAAEREAQRLAFSN